MGWFNYLTVLNLFTNLFSLFDQDIVDKIYYGSNVSFDTTIAIQVGYQSHKIGGIDISEVYSEFGRCYSIFIDVQVDLNATIKFILNTTK